MLPMHRIIICGVLALATAAYVQGSGSISLYDGYAGDGTAYTFTDSSSNVGGVAGKVSGFIVESGVWRLLTEENWEVPLNGQTEFGPGEYNFCTVVTQRCTEFNDRAHSLQLVPGPAISLYKAYAGDGTAYTFTDSSPNIAGGIAGKVSGFIVESGVWSLYTEENYGGTKISLNGQTEFGPGKYNFCPASCTEFNDKTLSLKQIPGPAISLYNVRSRTGTPYTFTDSSPNIGGVARRVSGLIVESGVWSLYTEENYGGTKISLNGRTEFGPGEYNFCTAASCTKFNDKTFSVKLIPGSAISLYNGYAGDGTAYTFTDSSPNVGGVAGKVSGFIVESGVWSLYTEENYGGTKISLIQNGKTEFGPGEYSFCTVAFCTEFNDDTLSVKLENRKKR